MFSKSVSPRGFSGPIGKLFASCANLPSMKNEPIGDFNLHIEPSDPRTDQTYLYKVCCSVTVGKAPESLPSKHAGNMSHAS